MKAFPWFLAAVGIAAAAYLINSTPGPEYATGSDTVEDAARKAVGVGTKTRVRGAGGQFVGKAKQVVGEATGNDELANEGAAQQVGGQLKQAAGSVAQAAGQAIHDLNR